MKLRSSFKLQFIFLSMLLGLFLFIPLLSQSSTDAVGESDKTVTGLEFLGEATFETGLMFDGTEVGGLSGITYDQANRVYFSLSDDRSQFGPARFYRLTIDLSDGSLDDGDIAFTGVTTLLNGDGEAFPEFGLDPEGIVLTNYGTLFISSEGDARLENLLDPFVREFSLGGEQLAELPVAAKFRPYYVLDANGATEVRGVRNNLAFESLTITPDGQSLFTATENALIQDGPPADVNVQSLSRIIKYDLPSRQPVQEFVYITDPVAAEPIPADSFRVNGLVELLAIDNNGTFLALERSFSVGVGNAINLYEVRTQGAQDVLSQEDLFREEVGVPAFDTNRAVKKRLLLDFDDLGLTLDNVEGMTFGPDLPDGRKLLILVSDNNFFSFQFTQFLAFAVDLAAQ